MAGTKLDKKAKAEALLFGTAFESLKLANPDLAAYVQADKRYPSMMSDYLYEADVPEKGDLAFQAHKDRQAALDTTNWGEKDPALKDQADGFYADVKKGLMPAVAVAEAETPDLTDLFNVPATPVDNTLVAALNAKAEKMAAETDVASAENKSVIVPLSYATPIAALFREVVTAPKTEPEPVLPPMADPIFIAALSDSDVEVSDLAPLPNAEKIAAISQSHVDVADLAPASVNPLNDWLSSEIKLRDSFVEARDLSALPKKPELDTMTVKRNDTLSEIVHKQYGSALKGQDIDAIYKAIANMPENKAQFEKNADRIKGADFDDYILFPKNKLAMPKSLSDLPLEKPVVAEAAPIPMPRLDRSAMSGGPA